MKRIEREVGNAFDRAIEGFRSMDRAFGLHEPMSMDRFLQHIRGGTVKRIRVIVGNRVSSISMGVGGGWLGSMPIPCRFSFVTEYHSFGESGTYKEESNEHHFSKEADEVSTDEVRRLEEQNMLTAYKRVEELQNMFPGIEVVLAISEEKDPMKRIGELRQQGLQPFTVGSLEP